MTFRTGRRAAALLAGLAVSSGCGNPVVIVTDGADEISSNGAAGPSTPPLASATAPATLTAVSPAVVQAGSHSSVVTLQATGIAAGAVVLVDGARHDASLVSSTAATFTLSAAERAVGTRHSITIQNPGLAASNAKTLLVTGGYWSFGDSITLGVTLANPSTQNYTSLLASAYQLQLMNGAVGGDQVCDVWPQMFRANAGYTAVAAPLFSLMIGTNDVDQKGTGAYERVFSACDLAALSWLGTPREAKLLAADTGISTSGACVNAANGAALGAILCSGSLGTVTAVLTTTGNPVYVWYLISDSATSNDQLTITLDGTATGTFATKPSVPIATHNGGTLGIAVARIAAAAGAHTVRISTTGLAGILGVGSNPAGGADHPRLLVGDLPNQAKDLPVSPVASQLVYLADIVAVEQQLLADGMDVHRAFTREYMLGTVSEMSDQLHPNATGQRELEKSFKAALP